MRDSAHRRPSSVSTAVTRRAPRSAASSDWVPVRVRGREGLDRRRSVIVTQDAADGIHDDGFAVCAGAVQKEQSVRARVASECITQDTLHEADKLGVVVKGAVQDLAPQSALTSGVGCRDTGNVVVGFMLAARACP